MCVLRHTIINQFWKKIIENWKNFDNFLDSQ